MPQLASPSDFWSASIETKQVSFCLLACGKKISDYNSW